VKLLLDTHAFLWWLADNPALSVAARTAIENTGSEVHVSAASVWEVTTKFRLGKLQIDQEIASDPAQVIARQGFTGLPVSIAHGQAAGALPGPH
jgi:PIN domain nuclease of toxin-antitoxin system